MRCFPRRRLRACLRALSSRHHRWRRHNGCTVRPIALHRERSVRAIRHCFRRCPCSRIPPFACQANVFEPNRRTSHFRRCGWMREASRMWHLTFSRRSRPTALQVRCCNRYAGRHRLAHSLIRSLARAKRLHPLTSALCLHFPCPQEVLSDIRGCASTNP